ncbi:MAG: type II toxin-antitoxin system RelE/ParE family toxin [Candidatus Micrarchaeota archaeon]|nr:type II toxin-antitoxin system RelE/ParE family toxin [Candidatus Micrarchaeota archaeon]
MEDTTRIEGEKAHEVFMTHRCEKELHKLLKKDSNGLGEWMNTATAELSADPTLGIGLRRGLLPGHECRAIHSKDNRYRIVYIVEEGKVLILGVGHRSNIYDDITNAYVRSQGENRKRLR